MKKGQYADRGPGGRRKVNARTASNAEEVETELEMMEGLGAGGASVRRLAARLRMSKSSGRDIPPEDLAQRSLAEIAAGALDVAVIVFTDEPTLRCSEKKNDVRANRAGGDAELKAKDVPERIASKPGAGYSVGATLRLCASK